LHPFFLKLCVLRVFAVKLVVESDLDAIALPQGQSYPDERDTSSRLIVRNRVFGLSSGKKAARAQAHVLTAVSVMAMGETSPCGKTRFLDSQGRMTVLGL
jgi:hypothetical protein